MHPDLFGIRNSSYWIMVALGLVACIVMYKVLADRQKQIDNRSYNLYSLLGVISIAFGFVFAYVFQGIYDAPHGRGLFVSPSEGFGLTFMGGLLGGVAAFVLGALFFATPKAKTHFWTICNILAPCVTIALFFGRMGCTLAGCCYGIQTDFLGIRFSGHQHPVVPTQLYEGLFSLALTIVLLVIYFLPQIRKNQDLAKHRNKLLVIFLFSYSIFRFFLEFLRNDWRGGGANGGISPSQVQSILMLGAAIAILIVVHIKGFVPFGRVKVPDSADNTLDNTKTDDNIIDSTESDNAQQTPDKEPSPTVPEDTNEQS